MDRVTAKYITTISPKASNVNWKLNQNLTSQQIAQSGESEMADTLDEMSLKMAIVMNNYEEKSNS